MAFGFFDDALGGRVKLDRAGYFGYGQKIFMSATFDKDINIGGKTILFNITLSLLIVMMVVVLYK